MTKIDPLNKKVPPRRIIILIVLLILLLVFLFAALTYSDLFMSLFSGSGKQ